MRGESPPAANARKTHCKRGHPLSGENLLIQAEQRKCRTCEHQRRKKYHGTCPDCGAVTKNVLGHQMYYCHA